MIHLNYLGMAKYFTWWQFVNIVCEYYKPLHSNNLSNKVKYNFKCMRLYIHVSTIESGRYC